MTSLARPASPKTSTRETSPRPPPINRRPSAMRNSSSDQIITPAVTRFDRKTTDIPPSPTFPPENEPSEKSMDSTAVGANTSSSSSSPFLSTHPSPFTSTAVLDQPPPLVHRAATSPGPRRKMSTSTSPPPPTLLARRRSSRSTARPNFLPKLDDLKLPALPTPPLETLDDTVVPEVVGVSSQAQTPFAVSPTSTGDVVEEGYRPTKTFVATPFPTTRRKSFFEDSDEEEEGRGSDDEDATSTAESSVLDEATDGVRRFSLVDETDKVSLE